MAGLDVESSGTAPAGEVTSRLRFFTLARVFVRSLALQASWNRRGMQNLGFAYAIWPALEVLYPDPERRLAAARRHLAPFNTHPYLAAAILGGSIYHEERVARGDEPPEAVERFKQALMGPLAAVGDSFYWLSLRPFTGAVAALLAPFIGLWVVPVFLVAFNLPHLALRYLLFLRGIRTGDRVVNTVAHIGLPAKGARLRVATAALGGMAAAFAGLFAAGETFADVVPAASAGVAAAAAAITWLGSFWILGKRGPVLAAYWALALGLFLAFLGDRL